MINLLDEFKNPIDSSSSSDEEEDMAFLEFEFQKVIIACLKKNMDVGHCMLYLLI